MIDEPKVKVLHIPLGEESKILLRSEPTLIPPPLLIAVD